MNFPGPLFPDDEELRSFVKNLLDKVERQSVEIERLKKENEILRAEIRHLKKQKGQPVLRANVKHEPDELSDGENSVADETAQPDKTAPPKNKRPQKHNIGETAAPPMTVDREVVCSVEHTGESWRFKGYTNYHHTDLELKFITTCYRREYYQTPEGSVTAPLPESVRGRYGDNLKVHLIDLYHSCSTTQPLLLSWLHSHGCSISEGALSNILTQGHEVFHEEKESLLEAGLSCSTYLQTDDTGARHQGENGYCLFVGNNHFSYFSSSNSKSRVNFLSKLLGSQPRYILDDTAFGYMEQVKLPQKWITALRSANGRYFTDLKAWKNLLKELGVSSPEYCRKATEGALKAALVDRFKLDNLIIHSDGARQFDTAFKRSLCWYHAGRNLDKLIPESDRERVLRDQAVDRYWNLYDDIEAYKQSPSEEQQKKIRQDFDEWVTEPMAYPELQSVLGQLMVVKEELLLVLKYPWLPLHNNLSERQIREYVKRRKVSGGTRSELGRRCRDTFASLKKTCKQHKISFVHYLKDRLTGLNSIPRLSELIMSAAASQNQSLAGKI